MIWLLLECGANFNQQSLLGHTALSYVKHLHHWDSESIMTGHIDRYSSKLLTIYYLIIVKVFAGFQALRARYFLDLRLIDFGFSFRHELFFARMRPVN